MSWLKIFDISLSVAVAVAILGCVVRAGDFLYLGLWYYAASSIAVIGCAAYLLQKPFFTLGGISGLAASLLPYWAYQTTSARPEGLLGLVHFFSMPTVVVGLWLAARAMRTLNTKLSLVAPAFGAIGVLGGELLGEVLLCGLRLACGPTSFWLFF